MTAHRDTRVLTIDEHTQVYNAEMSGYAQEINSIEGRIRRERKVITKAKHRKWLTAKIRYITSSINFVMSHKQNFKLLDVNDKEVKYRETTAARTIAELIKIREYYINQDRLLNI